MRDPHQFHLRPHRDVIAQLVTDGWGLCGIGDWAITLRSPDGWLAARVCPFDPAYPVFVRLCRSRPGDALLPRVDAHVDLDGGAHLTVMEFLRPCESESTRAIAAEWRAGHPRVAALREAAETLNAEAAAKIPWWDGIDLNEGNIMTSWEGQPKLVDVFCVDGAAYYDALLHDPDALEAAVPVQQRRHMTDIAFIHRASTPEEIDELRRAASV